MVGADEALDVLSEAIVDLVRSEAELLGGVVVGGRVTRRLVMEPSAHLITSLGSEVETDGVVHPLDLSDRIGDRVANQMSVNRERSFIASRARIARSLVQPMRSSQSRPTFLGSTASACICHRVVLRLAPDAITSTGSRWR